MTRGFILATVLLAFGHGACSSDTRPAADGPLVKKESGATEVRDRDG